MGTICQPKQAATLRRNEQIKQKEVIKIKDITQEHAIKFEVSIEKLIHISADMLVLFMDHSTNIKRNDHFIKLPMQGTKLQEHAKAYLEKNKLSDSYGTGNTKFITFGIIIPTLNFNKVSIVFCDTWREGEHNERGFKNIVRGFFEQLNEAKIKNIAITEFTSELGFHLEKGVKRLMREIIRMENKPDVVQFCCLNEQSKAVYMDGVHSNREQLVRSFVSTRSASESDYF